MDFQKKNWQFRDIISEDELNRIEDGIEEGIAKAEDAKTSIESHENRQDNPHNVTKQQVGLGNVDNVKQASKSEFDAHVADYVRNPGYAEATGTANNYEITLNPAPNAYVEGMAIAVKINVNSTGAATLNVNGLGAIPLKKSDGTTNITNLKAGGVYPFRYSNGNFILQGEGGSGNAQPGDVLTGKTFTNDDGEQVGTMPNRGAVNQNLTNQGQQYTIPEGYHNGAGKVTANISNLTAGNVRYGATVGGVAGTFSQFSNGATAAQILTGRSAAVNGQVVNGAMADRAGNQPAQAVRARNNTILGLRPQNAGYYPAGTGNWLEWEEPNWKPENIVDGVQMFGKTGTAKKYPRLNNEGIIGFASVSMYKGGGFDGEFLYSCDRVNVARKHDLNGTLIKELVSSDFSEPARMRGYTQHGVLFVVEEGSGFALRHYNENGTLIRSRTLSFTPETAPVGCNGDYYVFLQGTTARVYDTNLNFILTISSTFSGMYSVLTNPHNTLITFDGDVSNASTFVSKGMVRENGTSFNLPDFYITLLAFY